MLHVTNGSVMVNRIHDLGLPGHVLPWDDILHEGPVRADRDPAALRRDRAAFLAGASGGSDEIERSLALRDRTLAQANTEDEVVLWFEHDLYDQLHILQVLDQVRHPRVSAVLSDDYLSPQKPETLAEWFDHRCPVSPLQQSLAAEAWQAFRAADPAEIVRFCDRRGAEAARLLPHLVPALRRHLQQFPWVGSGLSRTELETLRALAQGPAPAADLFAAVCRAEEAVFMGDFTWFAHIRPLLQAPRPLLDFAGDRPSSWDAADWWHDERMPQLALTGAGRDVIAGRTDHIALNGIDRWLGGVHLTPSSLWRWNDSSKTIER